MNSNGNYHDHILRHNVDTVSEALQPGATSSFTSSAVLLDIFTSSRPSHKYTYPLPSFNNSPTTCAVPFNTPAEPESKSESQIELELEPERDSKLYPHPKLATKPAFSPSPSLDWAFNISLVSDTGSSDDSMIDTSVAFDMDDNDTCIIIDGQRGMEIGGADISMGMDSGLGLGITGISTKDGRVFDGLGIVSDVGVESSELAPGSTVDADATCERGADEGEEKETDRLKKSSAIPSSTQLPALSKTFLDEAVFTFFSDPHHLHGQEQRQNVAANSPGVLPDSVACTGTLLPIVDAISSRYTQTSSPETETSSTRNHSRSSTRLSSTSRPKLTRDLSTATISSQLKRSTSSRVAGSRSQMTPWKF